MSNKDSNGFERPWQLHVEYTKPGDPTQKRYKVVDNPDYHPSRTEPYPSHMAFAFCCKDAILHSQEDAARAMDLHLRDLNKWP